MSNGKVILVTGATGQQGGAAARHLLQGGFRVRALTRDVKSPTAQALAKAGAEVVEGDLFDRASVDRAIAGAYGVFSVQNFWLPEVGEEGEIRQGKLLADAAKAAGVKHFVYTSVGGAERKTGLKHFDSKWIIEEHIRSLGLPATMLRPVFFMENLNFQRNLIPNGVFASFGIWPGRKLQLIAVDDIGAFTRLALEKPDYYIGRALELAGDELTEAEIAATLGRVTNRTVEVTPPQTEGGQSPDAEFLAMIQWFNEKGYEADIPALRKLYPQLHNLETWASETGW